MEFQKEEKSTLSESSPLREVLQCFPSKSALSTELGVSRQCISQMEMDKPLPRVHYLTLRYELHSHLYASNESVA